MVDLTCRSFPYDRHLVEALRNIGYAHNVDFWGAGARADERERDSDIMEQAHSVVDFAGRLPGHWGRKVGKAIEYMVNSVALHGYLWHYSPDIVHYQWLPFAETIPALEVLNIRGAKRSGAGVVYTVHNVLPHDSGDRYRETFQRIYRIPDALVCHTKESKDQLIRDFDLSPNKVWVIPHGPLSDEISFIPREEARDRLQIDSEIPLCLLFGHIRPYKGADFLIESWQHVKRREPSARLMLAGQPEDGYDEVLRDKIKTLELEGVTDTRFEFLPQEKLNLCIHAADVLVYPYRSITQSGALLTGLATGKPIVATNIGGFSEMIHHEQTGVLVEYGNKEQLAKELVHLMRNAEKREQLGRAAREMVETEYSWNVIARKTLVCYQSVMS